MKKFVVGAVFALILIIGLIFQKTRSQNQYPHPSQSPEAIFSVSTSFYPLYFFVSQIGKDRVQVSNITPSGAEPHDYEPTTQDIAKIEQGKMLILNGRVEAWGDKIKENLKDTQVTVVTAGQGLLTKQLTEAGQTTIDPHVWLSPMLAKKEVNTISQAMIQADAKDQSFFEANTAELKQRLDALDQDYRRGLVNCKEKDIITSHAAFGYLAAEYGLNQVPIAGLSPDAEPSPKQLADIANFAKQHHVKYIFFESLISPKLSDTIATEVGAQTLVLDPLEGISDADMRQGNDYFTVMRTNLVNLQTALQCTN